VEVADVPKFEKKFLEFLRSRHSALMKTIRESGELTPDTDKALAEAVKDFAENYFLAK
jgi:F0F1-type ATP synthase alpha subunit